MSRGRRSEYVQASDRLIARNNGVWAKEKLSFLDEFGPPALKATAGKHQRWYIDLFAGPGVNVDDEETGEEFEGAALRALKMTAPRDERLYFTHLVLVNLNKKAHAALGARVNRHCEDGHCRAPRSHVHLIEGDANELVYAIMRRVDPMAYAFVFADIEKRNQLPFSTVRALKAFGHKSVDLFVLFPLEMAINRMLSYNKDSIEVNARALTTFFGTEDWRPLAAQRITDAQSADLRRQMLELYMGQLRRDWTSVQIVRDVRRRGEAGLYKMLFATNHIAGQRIGEWSAEQPRKRDQLDFGL